MRRALHLRVCSNWQFPTQVLNPREYILSSTDCSVLSQLFRVAQQARCFKPGSKPSSSVSFLILAFFSCWSESLDNLIFPSSWMSSQWSYTTRYFRRCPWCNCYRRRKWTRRHEFKSWTRLIAFHIALIPLGKVWIQLFSLQLWVNSRTHWALQPWWGN